MNLCSRLKKPSQVNAKVMADLFPSFKSSSTKKIKFDPVQECVATEQQRKKKAANPKCKGRAKCISVVVLKDIPPTIPKGMQRDSLRSSGYLKELWFRRILSEEEVTTLIRDGFKAINLEEFEYLQCCKNSSLKVAVKQNLNGNEVVTLAGSGCLYVHELAGGKIERLISNAKEIVEKVKVSGCYQD